MFFEKIKDQRKSDQNDHLNKFQQLIRLFNTTDSKEIAQYFKDRSLLKQSYENRFVEFINIIERK